MWLDLIAGWPGDQRQEVATFDELDERYAGQRDITAYGKTKAACLPCIT